MTKRLLIFLLFFFLSLPHLPAQEAVHLWEGTDAARKGKNVVLTPYLAENNPDGTAIIVCPGGSYYWLDVKGEGIEVAKFLQANGISAFVLQYRTAGFGAFFCHYRIYCRGRQYPDMITDAQRALQWVREHSADYQIDANKVGMMGFSAGGHLVMSAACFSGTNYLKKNGIETEVNLRPDFVAPIYPVVTMTASCVHKRSRTGLLGEWRQNSKRYCELLSLEKQIPADCPPVFLVNCVDDPVVDYHNSELLDAALTEADIPHRYIQYQTGGHGFGVSEIYGTEECRVWKYEFLKWLETIKQ